MESLRKPREGEPFKPSVKVQSALIDAALAVQALQGRTPDGSTELGGSGIAQVKNNSGIDRDHLNVLGIDDVFPAPVDNPDYFDAGGSIFFGVTPDADDHTGKFVILLGPLKAGKVGPCIVAGETECKINVTDEGHGFADVKDGDAGCLASASSGTAQILWKESGTGVKRARIRFGGAAGVGEATVIRFQVNEPTGVEYTDSTFSIDNVTIMLPIGATSCPGGSAPTSVSNVLGFPAYDNAPGFAIYNQNTQTWEGVPEPAIDPCGCYY